MSGNSKAIRKLIYVVLILFGQGLMGQDPPDITLIFYLDENSENNTLVGRVQATDPDGDPLTYSFVSGNDAGGFAIGSVTGDITVADETVLDFEITPSFSLMVEADDGNGGMTTASVTINLNDLDEALGIDDDINVFIFPNPATDLVYVDWGAFKESERNISLFTVDGSRIPVRLRSNSGTRDEIDVSLLNQGVYLLKIVDAGKQKTIRIVKQN